MDRIYSPNEADEFAKLFKGHIPTSFIVEDDKILLTCDDAEKKEVSPVLLYSRHEETLSWRRNTSIQSYDIQVFLRDALRLFEKEGKSMNANSLADFLKDQMGTVGHGKSYSSY